MPILLSETDLSAADYASLQDNTGSMSASITVERYGPVWDVHPDTAGAGRTGSNFDATLVGEYIVRCGCNTSSEISVEYLPSEVSGVSDAEWMSVPSGALNNIHVDIDLSVVAGTLNLVRVFYVDGGGKLVYSECTDITSTTFGSPVTVVTPTTGSINFVAAVSTTKVYYVVINSSYNNRMYVAEKSGGTWTSVDSGVFWPMAIRGFDAVSATDYDVLLISGEMPPLLGVRVVGVTVTTSVNRVHGVIAFEVKNNRWSDWMPVDVNDNPPDNYPLCRRNVRLSYVNDILFAVYRRSGGIGVYEYDKIAVMRSKDARNWEFPEFLPSGVHPSIIIPRSDYLYLVNLSSLYRSPKCAWAGQTPVSYNVTPYVLGLESQVGDIRNSSLALANPPSSTIDVFEGAISTELPMLDDRMQIKYNLGYFLSGDATRIHVSTEDVVSRNEQRNFPKLNAGIATRDYLGRMNRVRSDYAAEWPSTQCGADDYNDPTGTGHGGLRHTAIYEGSFRAEDGLLKIGSNYKECLAVSTFVSDALNGSEQLGFTLTSATTNEYAGIAFRIYDKNNLFYVAWHPDEDQFILVKRIGADNDAGYTDSTVDTVDTSASGENLGWVAAITTTHYMRVVVQYSQVYLYVSADGKTWSSVTWAGTGAGYAELPGQQDRATQAVVWSGRFGVIAYGFSDEDTSPWTPAPWLPPTIEQPSDIGAFVLCDEQIAITFDISPPNPIWYNADPNDDLADAGMWLNVVAYKNKAYLTTQDTDTEASGLWYCSNTSVLSSWTSGVVWTLVKSAYDAALESNPGQSEPDSGYLAVNPQTSRSCKLASMSVSKTGEFCVPLHSQHSSFINRLGDPGSGAYIGQAGSLTYTRLLQSGSAGDAWITVHPIQAHNLHCIGHDGTNWHLGCTAWQGSNWEGKTIKYSGGWGTEEDYFPEPDRERNMACVGGNYAVGSIGGASAGFMYEDFLKTGVVVGVRVRQLTGLYVGNSAHYLYIDSIDTDKLYQDGVEIADAPSEFGDAGANSGTAIFVIGSDVKIMWILGNEMPFVDVNVIVYSPDNGATWEDKTGNLRAALGDPNNWNGRIDSNTGNTIVRTFEIYRT